MQGNASLFFYFNVLNVEIAIKFGGIVHLNKVYVCVGVYACVKKRDL